jgi:hypothetical protein
MQPNRDNSLMEISCEIQSANSATHLRWVQKNPIDNYRLDISKFPEWARQPYEKENPTGNHQYQSDERVSSVVTTVIPAAHCSENFSKSVRHQEASDGGGHGILHSESWEIVGEGGIDVAGHSRGLSGDL